jgi:membrane protein implicated in regulation of membrane protease activity
MKADTGGEARRREKRVELLGAGVFLKGAAIVFFLGGALFALAGASAPVLLFAAFAAVVCWTLSLVVRALAAMERNTRKDSGEAEVPGPTSPKDSEGP